MTREERERAADELERRRAMLALLVVERQYAEDPSLLQRWGERGFRTSVRDAEHVVAVLAEALALGDADAFGNQLVWLRGVLDGAGVPRPVLERHLDLLADLLAAELDGATAAEAAAVLAHGRRMLVAAEPAP